MWRRRLRNMVRIPCLRNRKLFILCVLTVLFVLTMMTLTSFNWVKNLDGQTKEDFAFNRRIHEARVVRTPREEWKLETAIEVSKTKKFQELKKHKARLTAIALQEQGMDLSRDQKKLMNDLTPFEKAKLVSEFHMVRLKQERLHLDQLRKAGHIEPLPGGGERIVASKVAHVRFPSSLKALDPRDWPNKHKIYLNLTYSPWINMGKCSDLRTSFATPGQFKPVALASFPSSGNSWLRFLIDCASGIFSGSMYEDSSLTRKGLFGEAVKFDSGMTLLQKSHGYTTGKEMYLPHSERVQHNHMGELNHRAVLVIRNPFKALLSHRNLDRGGHTGYALKSDFVGEDWEYFVSLKTKLWKEFYADWLESSARQDIHVVFYEDLKNNSTLVLEGILKFFSVPIDSDRMSCISRNFDVSFLRKPPNEPQFPKDPFQRKLKDLIYQAIDDLSNILHKTGHQPLPLNRYEYFDPLEAKISRNERVKSDPQFLT